MKAWGIRELVLPVAWSFVPLDGAFLRISILFTMGLANNVMRTLMELVMGRLSISLCCLLAHHRVATRRGRGLAGDSLRCKWLPLMYF